VNIQYAGEDGQTTWQINDLRRLEKQFDKEFISPWLAAPYTLL
jgi:hypothetical protein